MKQCRGIPQVLVAAVLISVLSSAGVLAQEAYDPTEEIAAIQARIDAKGYGWVAGETELNQIPPEERAAWLGFLPPDDHEFLPADDQEGWVSGRDLPAVWDWREQGGVTPVKSQGGCGSCWIFAATAAFESVIKIYNGVEVDLSEQQILVCNIMGAGCSGGVTWIAYDHFMGYGAVGEECMPYMGNDNLPCTEYECDVIDRLTGYQALPNGLSILKERVYDHPVAVSFTAQPDFWSYDEGCYESDQGGQTNHAMVLVGWDDTMCEGAGAWIVKNSWGTYWGMDGYAYIKYGTCNIGAHAHEIFYNGVGPVHIVHQPLGNTLNDRTPYPVDCEVVARDYPLDEGSVYLHYSLDETWIDVLMTRVREGESGCFHAEIPAQPRGSSIRYWLSAGDTGGNTDVDPAGAPVNCHEFAIVNTAFTDDVEIDRGWTIGEPDDDATSGLWERGIPEGTWGPPPILPGNPDTDHTPYPGVYCFCTGPLAGNIYWDHDVDGGKTTLLMPEIDMREMYTGELTYYRWYTNNAGINPGEDYWQVDVTNDGGLNWVNLEYTNVTDAYWKEMSFVLEDYLPLDAFIQVRFIAADYLNPSNVEAGIDDVILISSQASQDAGGRPMPVRIRLLPPTCPTVGATTLHYALPNPVNGSLRIFAVDGRPVRTLLTGQLHSGRHSVLWDGRDDRGLIAPAGMYLIRLRTEADCAAVRLLRLR